MQVEELFPDVNLEDQNTEFKGIIQEGKNKKGQPEEIGWLKTIAAFANTTGGRLYIGVEDKSHKIVALDHSTADKINLMIHRQIRQRITPAIHYDIQAVSVPGTSPIRYVIVVSVSANSEVPVVVHEEGLLGIYVRNFGETDVATTEQIRDMVLMSESIPYDAAFTEEKFNQTDFQHLYQVAADRNVKITEKQLISIGFMSPDLHLSRGALLFKDHCNDVQTKTVASQWPDFTKGSDVILATEEYTGDLLTIIEQATRFIKNHSVNGFRKEADRRVDFISYPERSITEGVVNAVGHRNYFIQGAQIEINVFRDRLEITSPGSLLGVRKLYKEKNIASIIPRRRNEVICAVLEMCRYMEKKGSGFDKIEADYAQADEAHKPYISSDSSSFTLTLPDLTFTTRTNISVLRDSGSSQIYSEKLLTGKYDEKVLSFCYDQAHTIKEIAAFIGLTPSTYFRKHTIERLVENGLLLRVAEAPAMQYKTNHDFVKKA